MVSNQFAETLPPALGCCKSLRDLQSVLAQPLSVAILEVLMLHRSFVHVLDISAEACKAPLSMSALIPLKKLGRPDGNDL